MATKRRAKGGRARSVVVVASARATTSPHSWVRVGFFFLIFRQKSDDTTLDKSAEKSPHISSLRPVK